MERKIRYLSLLFPAKYRHENRWASIILFAHVLFIMWLWTPVSTGPDSNGYYVQTRLLADEGRLWTEHEQPFQFISPHWLMVGNNVLISRYPPGLPLLQAIPYWLFGTGYTLLNPLFISGTLLAVYLLTRKWVGKPWALLALLITAVNPVMNSWAFQGDAHPAVVFFMVYGLLAIEYWRKNKSWIGLIPMALWMGMIPTFRYPEALYIPAFSLFIWYEQRWSLRGFLQGMLFGGIAFLPLLGVYAYNQYFFGTFGETGYGSGSALFSLWFFILKFIPYILMIIGYGVAVFSILGMAGLVWLCRIKDTRSIGILLTGIIVPVTLLYMAYYFFDGTMRFLMPTFPLYIIAGVWYLKYLHATYPSKMEKWSPRIIALTLIVCLIECGFAIPSKIWIQKDIYDVSQRISRIVPKNHVLIAPHHIQNQMDFLGGWKLVDASILSGRNRHRPGMPGKQEGKPDQGSSMILGGLDPSFMDKMMQHDKQQEIRKCYRDNKTNRVTSKFWQDLKKWMGNQKTFYWFGTEEQMRSQLPNEFSLKGISEIKMPAGGFHRSPPPGPPPVRPRDPTNDDKGRFVTNWILAKISL